MIFGLHLQDYLIFIRGGINRRDLARAIGAVQRVFDLLRGNAERRGFVAIDIDVELWILDLNVARHVEQLRQGCDPSLQQFGISVEFISIRSLES